MGVSTGNYETWGKGWNPGTLRACAGGLGVSVGTAGPKSKAGI